MTCYIASDHAGFEVKDFIKEYVAAKGHQVVDLGPDSTERVDYPDFAKKVSAKVLEDEGSYGILICGTGIGMSITANKQKGIRAAHCYDAYQASMARAHNDANVLCLGQRVSGRGTMETIVDAWISAEFEGGRHAGRVAKMECCSGTECC